MIQEDVITSVIEDVAGHDVVPLINVLKGRKNVSEFTIAEELKEEINTIRNKLYRLYDSSLVEFIRKKDKKKGWYIYYWTFVPSRVPGLIKKMKKKKLNKLKDKLRTEQGSDFFECVNKCMRLTFEKAMDFEFKCPECGTLMDKQDNIKKVEHMVNEVATLEKEINSTLEIEENMELEEIEEKPKVSVERKIKVSGIKFNKKVKSKKK